MKPNMKIFGGMKGFGLSLIGLAIMAAGCAGKGDDPVFYGNLEEGCLAVDVMYEENLVKSTSPDGVSADAAVHKVDVFVFDAGSERLERSASVTSVSDVCTFSVPAGEKLVFALLNGPDVSRVRGVADLMELVDCLSGSSLETEGLMMVGSAACQVVPGEVSRPEVVVGRMVSGVVLRSLSCDVAEQYGGMRIDCVYLGNAYVSRKISGECLDMVNVDGYADSEKKIPIGKNGATGSCPQYLYREIIQTALFNRMKPSVLYSKLKMWNKE